MHIKKYLVCLNNNYWFHKNILVPGESDYESHDDATKWNQQVTEDDYKQMMNEHKEELQKKRQVFI